MTAPAAPASALLAAARERLAGSAQERIGVDAAQRRIFGITRTPRIVPAGFAWHVGVLLITDAGVLATGDVLRARTEVRRGFTAESQRARAERAAAAVRGGFADGETLHVGWREIDVAAVDRGEASAPLSVRDGVVSVQWSSGSAARPLVDYLDEHLQMRGL